MKTLPPWLELALLEVGDRIQELSGLEANPRIVEYAATTTLGARSDEIPWCSSFVNWTMKQAAIKGTRSAAARSWLKWGKPLEVPAIGCVVVYSRPPNPTSGHVNLWIGERRGMVYGVGGNQSNSVTIARYPLERVLAYRWPS